MLFDEKKNLHLPNVNLFFLKLCEETISKTPEGQPRPQYIFNKCGTNIYLFTLQRFGPSPSPNFKSILNVHCIMYV